MTAKVYKERADLLVVARGLAPSREKAQALILAGEVWSAGARVSKAGQILPEDCELSLTARPPFVSRSGPKLAAALDAFGIDPAGKICADLGASTGGFTDCLLQRGAASVYAVDVGANQLDPAIAGNPRVRRREGVNARYLGRDDIPEPIALAVADLAFISLTLVLPALVPLLAPGADVVLLVKPQFEVGKGNVGKGGIVRDAALQHGAVESVLTAARGLGLEERGVIASPVLGAKGNQEFLAVFRKQSRRVDVQ